MSGDLWGFPFLPRVAWIFSGLAWNVDFSPPNMLIRERCLFVALDEELLDDNANFMKTL